MAMRIITASIVALLGMATSAAAYDPYPFQHSDGKWGYVDDDHCWVIEPEFQGGAVVQSRAGSSTDFRKVGLH